MKKIDIVNLIRAYADHDDAAFRNQANLIAADFSCSGDDALAKYIQGLLSDTSSFVPQSQLSGSSFFIQMKPNKNPIFWPDSIYKDVLGVSNAIKRHLGANKFLFAGKPGTGKTETAIAIASELHYELWKVDFSSLIDYKLGETVKNINAMFKEIMCAKNPSKLIILFDEIDSIALKRIDSNDLREMGRATTAVFQGLDALPNDISLIATSNLLDELDPALMRRFDFIVDFDRYSPEDINDIAKKYYEIAVKKSGFSSNDKLFTKILLEKKSDFSPAEIKNVINSAFALSDGSDNGYWERLYLSLTGCKELPLPSILSEKGYTYREIEKLTGTPKTTLFRNMRGNSDEQ